MSAAPYWASDDGDVTLHLDDCLDVLRTLPADSVDAIVTDPPAGIAFMGRDWDDFRRARWRFVEWLTERLSEALRVLKPGGHALVWSLPRTSHWTAWAVEDAGFEVRDCVLHVFGSGFPKGLDVSKAIDKALGAEREVIGKATTGADQDSLLGVSTGKYKPKYDAEYDITAPATPEAARWAGWNVALKPGQEMWWLARKPLQGTVAGNVLRWGTGALNVDGCRVGSTERPARKSSPSSSGGIFGQRVGFSGMAAGTTDEGRWPTNLVFTHSAACEPAGTRQVRGSKPVPQPSFNSPTGRTYGMKTGEGRNGEMSAGFADADGLETVEVWVCAADCPVGELDRQSGVLRNGGQNATSTQPTGAMPGMPLSRVPRVATERAGDAGGASRFFPVFRYQAKAPASERPRLEDGTAHETVKPLGFICWALRLVCPPGGTVLDMFAGSGPVGEACIIEGFRAVLIEQNVKSAELIRKRLGKPIQPVMFGLDAS